MPWTTPKTWISEVLSSAEMNTYLSDNTQYLYDEITYTPGEYTYTRGSAVDFSTTSTTFVDISNPNMVGTITTDGGDVRVTFAGSLYRAGGSPPDVRFAINYNGTDWGPVRVYVDQLPGVNVSFSYVFNGVSAGSHTFRMRWRTSNTGATAYLRGLHSHFSVRELK